jgi:hypothetical protein
MGPDHHRVFMYTPDLSVSNQKESRQLRLAIFERYKVEANGSHTAAIAHLFIVSPCALGCSRRFQVKNFRERNVN